jgi:hypothetical protein
MPDEVSKNTRLNSLRKNSCFVSGHDISRAVHKHLMSALAPEVLLFCSVHTFLAAYEAVPWVLTLSL